MRMGTSIPTRQSHRRAEHKLGHTPQGDLRQDAGVVMGQRSGKLLPSREGTGEEGSRWHLGGGNRKHKGPVHLA